MSEITREKATMFGADPDDPARLIPVEIGTQENVYDEAGCLVSSEFIRDEEATAALQAQNSPEERRRRAYEEEADPLLKAYSGYKLEADQHRLDGNEAGAAEADAKAEEKRTEYLQKKEEIRQRWPDEQYFLNSSGTYHRLGCSYVTGASEALSTIEIRSRQNVKPCTKCNPPVFEGGGE